MNNATDRFSSLLFSFLIGERKKHVDVGEGEEIFAAVPAKGQQGNIGRRLAGEGASPHFDQNPVDYGGPAPNRSSPIARTFTGLADERHLPKILIP